jgi:hypothetical protein
VADRDTDRRPPRAAVPGRRPARRRHHRRPVTGIVTVRGRPLRFAAAKADPPAGLYRARSNSAGVIGWIVLPDGSQVGIQNDGTPRPAPRLDPRRLFVTVGGAAVVAHAVTGDEGF